MTIVALCLDWLCDFLCQIIEQAVHFRIGIFGLTDIGRVYVDGQSSNKWHPAYGGGVFFSVLDLATVFSVAVATSEERTAVYLRAGYSF